MCLSISQRMHSDVLKFKTKRMHSNIFKLKTKGIDSDVIKLKTELVCLDVPLVSGRSFFGGQKKSYNTRLNTSVAVVKEKLSKFQINISIYASF